MKEPTLTIKVSIGLLVKLHVIGVKETVRLNFLITIIAVSFAVS